MASSFFINQKTKSTAKKKKMRLGNREQRGGLEENLERAIRIKI